MMTMTMINAVVISCDNWLEVRGYFWFFIVPQERISLARPIEENHSRDGGWSVGPVAEGRCPLQYFAGSSSRTLLWMLILSGPSKCLPQPVSSESFPISPLTHLFFVFFLQWWWFPASKWSLHVILSFWFKLDFDRKCAAFLVTLSLVYWSALHLKWFSERFSLGITPSNFPLEQASWRLHSPVFLPLCLNVFISLSFFCWWTLPGWQVFSPRSSWVLFDCLLARVFAIRLSAIILSFPFIGTAFVLPHRDFTFLFCTQRFHCLASRRGFPYIYFLAEDTILSRSVTSYFHQPWKICNLLF